MRISVFAVALAVLVVACGTPVTTCNASSCNGCCDAAGVCQPGSASLGCGFPIGVTGGGSGGGTGGGTAGDGSAHYCTDFYGAYSDLSARCGRYSAAGAVALKEEYRSVCATMNPWAGVKDGRQQFNSAQAAACLSTLRTGACNLSYPAWDRACRGVVVGLVPRNGACFESRDCAPGLECASGASCPGTCVPRIAAGQPVTSSGSQSCIEGTFAYNGVCTARVALGQSCTPTGGSTFQRSCVQDATCNAAGLCVAVADTLPDIGQACNNSDPSLWCGEFAQCTSGGCAKYLPAGSACGSVASGRCQYDLNCSAASVCVAFTVGEPCDDNQHCGLDLSLLCVKAPGQTAGTCALPRTVGQACSVISPFNKQCSWELACLAATGSTTGVCGAKKASGASCTDGRDECLGYCSNGICTAGACFDPTP